jgi:hypothetical protein
MFVCAALVLALAVWVTHSRRVAAEAAAHVAKVQASPSAQVSTSPTMQVPTNNDVEAQPVSAPQVTQDAGGPAAPETAAPAITGTLSQCLDNTGKTTIRQSPCPDDMKTVKVIPYSVQPGSQTVVEIPQQIVLTTPQTNQSRQPTAGEIAYARCNDAKKYAESERQRIGLNLNIDQVRSLEDIVHEACKSQ